MAKNILQSSMAFLLFALVMITMTAFVLAAPNGVQNPTIVNVSTLQSTTVQTSVLAMAGNVTELTVFGSSTTQSWQGFYGNVSGVIRLGDSSGNVMYNWTLASPRGEVYASTNTSVTWTGIECFNNSRLTGTNLTVLEARFNVNGTSDGIDETFYANNHRQFITGTTTFAANQCNSTSTYNSTAGSGSQFQEVLLYEPGTGSTVFTNLLEQDVAGFDNRAHDFQMMVLEDGHHGNVASTAYYFFVELE